MQQQQGAEFKSGDKVSTQTLSDLVTGKKSPETTALGTAARAGGEVAATVPGSMYAAGVGTEIGTASMPAVAAIPYAGPFIAPWMPAVGGVTGGLVASVAQSYGINTLEEFADKVFGTNIAATKKAQAQAHPIAEKVGQFGGMVIGPGGTLVKAKDLFTKEGAKTAAVGSGIMVGVGGAQRAIEGQPVFSGEMIWDAASGAFVKPSKLGEKLIEKGRTVVSGKPAPADKFQPPPDTATPEQRNKFIEKLKAEKAKRDAKAKLDQAAIKNIKTGEVELHGPKHDEARKAELKDHPDYVEGFVDERGNFHDRQAAFEQAKRAEQLPEDHVLEIPEEGLHSGDLRKVGDENFKITEEQPAGTSKEKVDAPVTREEHKAEIDKLQEEAHLTLEGHKQEALNAGDKYGVADIEAKQAAIEKQIEALQSSMPAVKFADKAVPTWEELHDHLWGSKTVGEAFDRVLATDDLGTKGQRLLLKALNQSDFIRSAELGFSSEYLKYYDKEGLQKADALGLYYGDEHKIDLGKEGNLYVLAHESIHAGTVRLLDEGNSTAAIKLQELFDKYKESHGDSKYGFTDVKEFVAEAFTNRQFQELLGSIKVGEQPKGVLNNLWAAFKNTVREGLNLPEGTRTALDEVFDHGISLVKKSKDFKPLEDHPASILDSIKQKASPAVADAFEKVDPRSVPNEEEMIKHATDLHDRFGEAEAVKFFEDYQKNLNERSIPIPNDVKSLEDGLHKLNTFQTKDRSEHVVGYKENTKNGVTEEQRAKWFDMRERGEPLPSEAKAVLDELDAENIALVRKIKAMGGDVGEEFTTGQSRIRLFSEKEKPGWIETLKGFFENTTPMGDRVADQANAAIERKVFALEDGRTIEFHRQPTDVTLPGGREVKAGTEIWEWSNGRKRLVGHSPDINFKRGDSITLNDGTVSRVVDGNVLNIERDSPYRYWHDAEASARIANTGLRKMARELEFVNNLKESKLFEQVGFGPDRPVGELPKGWVVPSNIDRIPELRGWHFDPKTAAIISDFAKVWDNTMWMKATNALVKNMMLNPVPHMFNEVMHLWNARGFTGWVDPRQLGTFAITARAAWRDVGNQTQFYRDIMREGGSILGADPRNKHFEALQKEAQKQMFSTPEMEISLGQLAKKLGTTTGDLYNGISNASTKAMWFTRDVMYVQYIREIMGQHEKRTGSKMELKDAIEHAEKHMPNYRMPSEVLGSRGLAQVLKNPNIDLFSRYHYGMVKSLVNTIKDVDPRNLRSPESRAKFREGVDSMLAIGVGMAFLYPAMDQIAQAMFGEGAEQRRAGPFHLLHAIEQVAEGKRDASALIWPVFTFNPMLLGLGQLAFNKNIFTGKPVYHPDDPVEDIAADIGTYGVKQVPQVSPVLGAVEDEDGANKLLARQFDIKVKTGAQQTAEKKALEREERAKKGRKTKREKGTYKP